MDLSICRLTRVWRPEDNLACHYSGSVHRTYHWPGAQHPQVYWLGQKAKDPRAPTFSDGTMPLLHLVFNVNILGTELGSLRSHNSHFVD